MNACFQLRSWEDSFDPCFHDELMDEDHANNIIRVAVAATAVVQCKRHQPHHHWRWRCWSSLSGQPPPPSEQHHQLLVPSLSTRSLQLQPLHSTQQPSFIEQDLDMSSTDESDAVPSYHKKICSINSRILPRHHAINNKNVNSSLDQETLLIVALEITQNVVRPSFIWLLMTMTTTKFHACQSSSFRRQTVANTNYTAKVDGAANNSRIVCSKCACGGRFDRNDNCVGGGGAFYTNGTLGSF